MSDGCLHGSHVKQPPGGDVKWGAGPMSKLKGYRIWRIGVAITTGLGGGVIDDYLALFSLGVKAPSIGIGIASGHADRVYG